MRKIDKVISILADGQMDRSIKDVELGNKLMLEYLGLDDEIPEFCFDNSWDALFAVVDKIEKETGDVVVMRGSQFGFMRAGYGVCGQTRMGGLYFFCQSYLMEKKQKEKKK